MITITIIIYFVALYYTLAVVTLSTVFGGIKQLMKTHNHNEYIRTVVLFQQEIKLEKIFEWTKGRVRGGDGSFKLFVP